MKISQTELQQRLSELARHREPQSDLWPGIAARLAPRARVRRYGAGVSAVAAVLVGAIALVLIMPRDPVVPGPSGRVVERTGPTMTYADAIDREYAGAFQIVGSPDASLSIVATPAEARMTSDLDLVENAAKEIRAALQADPDSTFLANLLVATHRKRVEMLRRIAATDAQHAGA